MQRCNLAFTAAGAGQRVLIIGLRACSHAFTMAEILLSLTIIGVVAAITLPSLTGNINERTWNTQRKALYARFSQAMPLMPSLNGFGRLREVTKDDTTVIEDTAAETFVTSGLSKVMKINNICDNEHLKDCGLPENITTLSGGEKINFPKTVAQLNSTLINHSADGRYPALSAINSKAVAFETANGESIAVYYNPYCSGEPAETTAGHAYNKMCANFIYDLNGSKGPNTAGKDIGFVTVLYPTAPVVVAPLPKSSVFTNWNVNNNLMCREKFGDEYGVPNRDELLAVFINKNLFDIDSNHGGVAANIVSSTKTYMQNGASNQVYWHVNWAFGYRSATADHASDFFCVKR